MRLSYSFITVKLDKLGPIITVPVRYSKRAKRIRIRIKAIDKSIELILPDKNLNNGYKFLLKHEVWIRQKLQEMQTHQIDSSIIPIFSKEHSLLRINSSYTEVKIISGTIHLYSPANLHMNTLIAFLQDKLLSAATEIVESLNKQLNFHVKEVRIMNNKTSWGTCSSKAVLSFHWRLVFAPHEILFYVVVHEMCHLVHMNHSFAFWNLVESLCPDYQAARLWLKENSKYLYQYCKE